MSIIARQSTARTVTVGPILDADGVAVTTAVVGDLKIAKNGAAPAALNASATLTHRNTGHYSLSLTASDTDTVGQAEIVIDATTNAMPTKVVAVIEETVYDALFAASATGLLPANVTQIGGDAQSATDLKDFADAGYDPSTNHITGIAGTKNTLDDLNDVSQADVTGGAYSLDTDANGRMRVVDGTGAGEISLTLGLIDGITGTINTLDALDTAQDVEHDATQAAIAALSIPTAAAIADAVLDEALSGHVTAGTLGKAIADIEADATSILADTGTDIPALINALNDLDAAGIRAAVGLASANMDTQFAALPTQAEITGGAYALDTDANGRVRIVDGTAAGELDTTSGLVKISGTKQTLDDLNDITVANVLTTQMTEAYAANGVAPTMAQALFAIHQMLMSFSNSGTTMTVRKLDNSTTAFLATLNDATSPTALSRAA